MYNDSADKISARPYHDYRAVKIEDADVFVAICPHSWSRPNPFAIQLCSGENREKLIYRVAIDPSASRTFRTIAFGLNPLKSEDCDVISCEDRNMIVRIVKTTKEFKTYINGHYMQPTEACDVLQAEDRKITGMSFNVDSQLLSSETALIHRWISSSSDLELMGRIEALANYMKNPFDSLWALILEREEEKEEVEKNDMAIVDEIECLSKLRKASDEEKAHLTMLKHILGAAPFDDIQKRHEQLMSSWVVSRGDNISSEAYDYLMYSQCMGWPKVVLEASSKGEFRRGVRKL